MGQCMSRAADAMTEATTQQQKACSSLPDCDCTTNCGDDDRIEKGIARPCRTYLDWRQRQADQRQLELDGRRMQALCRIINTPADASELQKAYREAFYQSMLKGSAAVCLFLDSSMTIQATAVQIHHDQ